MKAFYQLHIIKFNIIITYITFYHFTRIEKLNAQINKKTNKLLEINQIINNKILFIVRTQRPQMSPTTRFSLKFILIV